MKIYVSETGSVWINALCDPASGNSLHIACITAEEVVPALARRHRKGDIDQANFDRLLARFQFDLRTQYERAPGPATEAAAELAARFGKPQIVTPRLGQGSFRILVADAYGRRCTMTSERTFPALEAAHIHRYSRGGDHSLSNGLLLRSDLHKLFDLGYLTIEPHTRTIRVSRKIREEFENGRDYYRLDGQPIREPENALAFPSIEKLKYHYEHEFRA